MVRNEEDLTKSAFYKRSMVSMTIISFAHILACENALNIVKLMTIVGVNRRSFLLFFVSFTMSCNIQLNVFCLFIYNMGKAYEIYYGDRTIQRRWRNNKMLIAFAFLLYFFWFDRGFCFSAIGLCILSSAFIPQIIHQAIYNIKQKVNYSYVILTYFVILIVPFYSNLMPNIFFIKPNLMRDATILCWCVFQIVVMTV